MSAENLLETRDIPDERLRIAIVGSPRSGNTWLRGLLANILALHERAEHRPDNVGWETLPERCVLQLHWSPTAEFRKTLDEHDFRTVTPSRHPLDLLLSTLNYAYYTHDPVLCREDGCAMCGILGVSPRSPQFRDYARSQYARNVQGLSLAWWKSTDTARLRYEDLVADTAGILRGLCRSLGVEEVASPETIIGRFEIESIRHQKDVMHYHYWQGRPGHWRTMLTAEDAEAMAEPHRESFEVHSYVCDPDPNLEPLTADLNWYRSVLSSTRVHLRDEREKHRATLKSLDAVRKQLDHVHEVLWNERQIHAGTVAELERLRHRFDQSDEGTFAAAG